MPDITRRVPGCDDDCEGERAERGERGHRGHRGRRGHDGHDGPTGPTGPAAAAGLTGATGPTGPTAPTEFDNFVFRPGGVQEGNVYTSWPDLFAAMSVVQGWKTIQFDDTIVSPCVIPAGTWDMTDVEWTAFLKGTTPAAVAVSLGGAPSGGDFVLPNLRSFGGSLNPITNRSVGGAPVVIPSTGQYIVEIGEGTTGDFPQFNNAGPDRKSVV